MPDPDRILSGYVHHHLVGARSVVPLVEARAGDDEWAARMVPELREELGLVEMLRGRLASRRGVADRIVGVVARTGAQLKLRTEELLRDGFDELLELETIRLGVEGKKCLWLVCRDGRDDPRFAGLDASGLVEQAERQIRDVEGARRLAAAAAIGLPSRTDDGS
jgi:hypothetical protein